MNEPQLIKGNVALSEAAIKAGCLYYFGYPITPQNDIPEYLSLHLPEWGGTFVQAESEIASINMVMGASATGVRAMTSSSGPGISLMQEGMSYMAGSEIPGLVVNIMRCGPGLGGISPTQGDYFQATRGGGHGDYYNIVLAPASVQEMFDLTIKASESYDKPWATTGASGRDPQHLKTLYLSDGEQEEHNLQLKKKYDEIREKEVMYEAKDLDGADLFVVAFGTASRIVKTAMSLAKEEGLRVGLIRPITLFPFPTKAIYEASKKIPKALVVEMNTGQMLTDVQIAVDKEADVYFYGRPGGGVPTPEEVLEEMKRSIHANASV